MHGLYPHVHFKSSLLPFLLSSVHEFTFLSRRKMTGLCRVYQDFVLGQDFAQVPLHTHLTVHASLRHTRPDRHWGSSSFLDSVFANSSQRVAVLCFSSRMMPTYQDRTLTCCVSISVSIGTVWFLNGLFLTQRLQCPHMYLSDQANQVFVCMALSMSDECKHTDLVDVWYVQVTDRNSPILVHYSSAISFLSIMKISQ